MSDLKRWQSSPLYKPQRDVETVKSLRLAIQFLLIHLRDADPYAIEYHRKGCDGADVFDGSGALLDETQVIERDCKVCEVTYNVMRRLQDEGLLVHRHDATRAVQLARDVMEYGYSISLLSDADQELARIAIQESVDIAKQQQVQAPMRERAHTFVTMNDLSNPASQPSRLIRNLSGRTEVLCNQR